MSRVRTLVLFLLTLNNILPLFHVVSEMNMCHVQNNDDVMCMYTHRAPSNGMLMCGNAVLSSKQHGFVIPLINPTYISVNILIVFSLNGIQTIPDMMLTGA